MQAVAGLGPVPRKAVRHAPNPELNHVETHGDPRSRKPIRTYQGYSVLIYPIGCNDVMPVVTV